MNTVVGPVKFVLKRPLDRATIECIIQNALGYCQLMAKGKAANTYYPHTKLTFEFCRAVDNRWLYDEIWVSGKSEVRHENEYIDNETGRVLSMTTTITTYSPQLLNKSIKEFLDEFKAIQTNYAPAVV